MFKVIGAARFFARRPATEESEVSAMLGLWFPRFDFTDLGDPAASPVRRKGRSASGGWLLRVIASLQFGHCRAESPAITAFFRLNR